MQEEKNCGKETREKNCKSETNAHISGRLSLIIAIVPIILVGLFGQGVVPEWFLANYDERIEEKREYNIQLQYENTEEDGNIIFKNIEGVSDGWMSIQGQIVIKDKDNRHLKTFHVDGMYENRSIHVKDKDTFIVCRRECLNAENWVEKLKHLLNEEGYDDILVVEQIGFVSLSIQTKDQRGWNKEYFILEGESLVQIDDKTAERKKQGVYLTEEIFKNIREQEIIIEETRKCLEQIMKN